MRLRTCVVALWAGIGLSACYRDSSYEGRSADEWAHALASAMPGERAQAVRAFANIGPRQWSHVRPLMLAMNDPVPSTRAAVVDVLRRLPAESRDAVLRGLTDTSVAVRRAAALALGHFRGDDEDAVRALSGATRDPDDSVRTLAVLSLGERSTGARSALERIRQLATQPGPQRAAALLVLPNIDTESRSFAGPYYAALKDTSAAVRVAGATMLLAAGAGHEAMPLLVEALRDPVREVRVAAANALASEAHHDSVAYDAMVSLRASPDSVMRRLADSILNTVLRPR